MRYTRHSAENSREKLSCKCCSMTCSQNLGTQSEASVIRCHTAQSSLLCSNQSSDHPDISSELCQL